MSRPDSVRRPRLLVSVRDASEAERACAAGADLIDAKDPERGALGALAPEIVREIVARVAGRATTSAVAGEAEGDGSLASAVAVWAETGADFLKVAVTPGYRMLALADAAAAAPGRLIGVFFAEDGEVAERVAQLAEAGFVGAMIDTRGKAGRGLRDLVSPTQIAAFVAQCREHRLLCGLAGSLTVADIEPLAAFTPDYLGFRGGLCRGSDRRAALDPDRIAEAVRALRTQQHRDAA